MNTYTWKILSLEVTPQENSLVNVVKGVNYKIVAVSEDNLTSEVLLWATLNSPTESFTSYEELTEEQIISWIKNYLLSFDVEMIGDIDLVKQVYNSLDHKINFIRENSLLQKPLPW
jgi:hypothetical protein